MVKSITGYSDKISVQAGETIRFMVSCEKPGPYRAELVRVVCGDLNPKGPGVKLPAIDCPINGTYQGRHQSIHNGSYVFVPAAPQLAWKDGFTVQAMIWPTTPRLREQVLLSCWSARARRRLRADHRCRRRGGAAPRRRQRRRRDGRARASRCSSASGASSARASIRRRGGSASTSAGRSRMRGWRRARRRSARSPSPPAAAEAPLLMAARLVGTDDRGRRRTEAHYNGRIDSPRLSGRALPLDEALALHQRPLPERLRPGLIGAWDFAQEIPTQRVVDISEQRPARRDGQPAGARDDRLQLVRRRDELERRAARIRRDPLPRRRHLRRRLGQRLRADACPTTLRSGCYAVPCAARSEDEDYISFFVRRPRASRPRRSSTWRETATYLAYANHAFNFAARRVEMLANHLVIIDRWEQHLNLHPEFGDSLYDLHSDGSGICYSSRLRPVLNMRPKAMTLDGRHRLDAVGLQRRHSPHRLAGGSRASPSTWPPTRTCTPRAPRCCATTASC